MGWFSNLITGKPAFTNEQPQPNSGQPATPAPAQPAGAAPTGPKVLPLVTIGRTMCQDTGAQMQCELTIVNRSQQNVRLQRIELLGVVDELGEFLQPGGEREYSFSVNKLVSTQQNQARIFYHNDSGDYFCSVHQVNFEKMGDGSYHVHDFQFLAPVRDV